MISVSLSSHVSIHRLVHGRTIAGLLKKREKQDKKTVGRKAYVPLTWKEVWGDESRRRNILRDAAEKSEVRELPCDVLIDCMIVHPSDMIVPIACQHTSTQCMCATFQDVRRAVIVAVRKATRPDASQGPDASAS